MWNIVLPKIDMLFKKTEEEMTDFDREHNVKPLSREEAKFRDALMGKYSNVSKEYIATHSYKDYINVPEVNKFLQKNPDYEPIMYACWQCHRYNFARRSGETKNGTYTEQLTGIIAQTILADYLGQPRPNGLDGFDNGKDLMINGAKVDVKCMGRNCYMEHQWVHNLIKDQFDNRLSETDYFLFCSLDKKESVLQVCGYVQKNLIPQCANEYKKGDVRYDDWGNAKELKTDMFEVRQDVLRQINNAGDLQKKIWIDNITDNKDEKLVDMCVKLHRMMNKAEKGDKDAIDWLSKYENERLDNIIKNSTTSLLLADINYMGIDRDSIEYRLKLGTAKQTKVAFEANLKYKIKSTLSYLSKESKNKSIQKRGHVIDGR